MRNPGVAIFVVATTVLAGGCGGQDASGVKDPSSDVDGGTAKSVRDPGARAGREPAPPKDAPPPKEPAGHDH